jgi:hypothetical protein
MHQILSSDYSQLLHWSECKACKISSHLMRTVVDLRTLRYLTVTAMGLICKLIIKPGFGYDPRACKGMIHEQVNDFLFPVLDDFLEP